MLRFIFVHRWAIFTKEISVNFFGIWEFTFNAKSKLRLIQFQSTKLPLPYSIVLLILPWADISGIKFWRNASIWIQTVMTYFYIVIFSIRFLSRISLGIESLIFRNHCRLLFLSIQSICFWRLVFQFVCHQSARTFTTLYYFYVAMSVRLAPTFK